jgi:hypothetical protein
LLTGPNPGFNNRKVSVPTAECPLLKVDRLSQLNNPVTDDGHAPTAAISALR